MNRVKITFSTPLYVKIVGLASEYGASLSHICCRAINTFYTFAVECGYPRLYVNAGTYAKEHLSVYLEDLCYDKLEEIASHYSGSESYALSIALQYYLDGYPPLAAGGLSNFQYFEG